MIHVKKVTKPLSMYLMINENVNSFVVKMVTPWTVREYVW